MSLRFQADADLQYDIVLGLRRLEPGIDIASAFEARLAGLPDPEVLRFCAEAGRLLVTHDQRTMPHHFGRFVVSSDSPGVIIVPQWMSIGVAVEELHFIWATNTEEEWVNSIRRLPV